MSLHIASQPPLLDIDRYGAWCPALGEAIDDLVTPSVVDTLRAAKLGSISEMGSLLCVAIDNSATLLRRIEEWIAAATVVAYHGTRLTDTEAGAIISKGLKVLKASDRELRIREVLSAHSRWAEVEGRLPGLIEAAGPSWATKGYGKREGQVHLTLSRAALIGSFNHYLVEGSEFDSNIAMTLLGQDGRDLLHKVGAARIFKFELPGRAALHAANPYGTARQPINGVREISNMFARWLSGALETDPPYVDCGLQFEHDVPAEWLAGVEEVDV